MGVAVITSFTLKHSTAWHVMTQRFSQLLKKMGATASQRVQTNSALQNAIGMLPIVAVACYT